MSMRLPLSVSLGVAASLGLLAQSRATRPAPPQRPIERPIERVTPVDRPMDRGLESPADRRLDRTPDRLVRPAPRPQPTESRPVERAPYPRPSEPHLLRPRPLPRWVIMPTVNDWQRRDIMAEIQWMARRGSIAVHPVAEDAKVFQGESVFPAGWTAYGFAVPPGESLKVSLDHPNRGWFRLLMVNKWGDLEEGMLQNLTNTFEPVVTYTNPRKEPRAVYVIVDDPGWMSSKENPFTITVTRSWEPGKKKLDEVPVVTGIWAQK